jgi:hypothetical protein
MNRRQLLRTTGLGLVGGAFAGTAGPSASAAEKVKGQSMSLSLADYEPKSMLQVRETHIEKSRFPVFDVHTHITVSAKDRGHGPEEYSVDDQPDWRLWRRPGGNDW